MKPGRGGWLAGFYAIRRHCELASLFATYVGIATESMWNRMYMTEQMYERWWARRIVGDQQYCFGSFIFEYPTLYIDR